MDVMDFWTNVSNGGKWSFIGVLGIKVRAIFKSKPYVIPIGRLFDFESKREAFQRCIRRLEGSF